MIPRFFFSVPPGLSGNKFLCFSVLSVTTVVKDFQTSVSLCLCGEKLFLFFRALRVLRGEDFLVCASVVNQLFPATDSKSRCLFASFLCHSAAA